MTETSLVFPQTDWETATPVELGIDPAALAAAQDILARPKSNSVAIVVVKGGKIISERYYQGFGPTDRCHLFSVTKSVLSALVGIALHEGYLKSIDQQIADFIPEAPNRAGFTPGMLTLRHLLTMSAGLAWQTARGGNEISIERMRRSPDWSQFLLSLPVNRQTLGNFHYCSGASHLLSIVLTRATGQSSCDFARQRLFEPLGIRRVECGSDWENDPQGNTVGGWGLHLTAREIARFGWLYTCNGQWADQTIVPEPWVSASTSPAKDTIQGYGYQWWLRQVGCERVFAGLGFGGQYLFCVPGRQMVVAILARAVPRWPDRWNVLEKLLSSRGGRGE